MLILNKCFYDACIFETAITLPSNIFWNSLHECPLRKTPRRFHLIHQAGPTRCYPCEIMPPMPTGYCPDEIIQLCVSDKFLLENSGQKCNQCMFEDQQQKISLFWSKQHQVYWKSLNSFADCDRERCLQLNNWLNSILLFKTEAMFLELELFFFTYDQVEERRDNSWLNLPNHIPEMKRCFLITYQTLKYPYAIQFNFYPMQMAALCQKLVS